MISPVRYSGRSGSSSQARANISAGPSTQFSTREAIEQSPVAGDGVEPVVADLGQHRVHHDQQAEGDRQRDAVDLDRVQGVVRGRGSAGRGAGRRPWRRRSTPAGTGPGWRVCRRRPGVRWSRRSLMREPPWRCRSRTGRPVRSRSAAQRTAAAAPTGSPSSTPRCRDARSRAGRRRAAPSGDGRSSAGTSRTTSEMSHTQASPPSWQAIRHSRRRRTGSPRALNIRARSPAQSSVNGSRASGEQHAPPSDNS